MTRVDIEVSEIEFVVAELNRVKCAFATRGIESAPCDFDDSTWQNEVRNFPALIPAARTQEGVVTRWRRCSALHGVTAWNNGTSFLSDGRYGCADAWQSYRRRRFHHQT